MSMIGDSPNAYIYEGYRIAPRPVIDCSQHIPLRPPAVWMGAVCPRCGGAIPSTGVHIITTWTSANSKPLRTHPDARRPEEV